MSWQAADRDKSPATNERRHLKTGTSTSTARGGEERELSCAVCMRVIGAPSWIDERRRAQSLKDSTNNIHVTMALITCAVKLPPP